MGSQADLAPPTRAENEPLDESHLVKPPPADSLELRAIEVVGVLAQLLAVEPRDLTGALALLELVSDPG